MISIMCTGKVNWYMYLIDVAVVAKIGIPQAIMHTVILSANACLNRHGLSSMHAYIH